MLAGLDVGDHKTRNMADRKRAITLNWGGFLMQLLRLSAARLALLGGVCGLVPTIALAQPGPATSSAPTSEDQTREPDALADIVVTARRREEALQSVPVSITAITPEQLREKAIKDPYDLTKSVPGLNVRVGGATRETPDYFIRGQGNTFSGNPGVLVYFNEIPLGSLNPNLQSAAANLMIFDMASVQVLKGPQGTLFGKSSTGGAVLFSPQKPENKLGGYLDLQVGNYDMRELQGAVNVPVIEDKIAIRFAFDIARRDGFTVSQSTGQKLDQRHRETFRLGINLTPTEWLQSYFLLQQFQADEASVGGVIDDYNPNFALFNTTPGVGVGYFAVAGLCAQISAPAGVPGCIATRTGRIQALVAELQAEKARIDAGGSRRRNLTSRLDFQHFKTQQISNTTSVDIGEVPVIGDVTFKNIASVFRVLNNNVIREFGTNSKNHGVVINQYDLVGFPQAIQVSDQAQTSPFRRNFSEEFQILGDIGGKHNWILGYFLANGSSDDIGMPPIFQTFNNALTVPLDSLNFIFPTTTTYGKRKEIGYYGQFTADLSDLLLDGLHLTGGYRLTRDSTYQIFNNYTPSPTGLVIGSVANIQDFREKASSYTITVDYKASPDLLLYLTTRKGFKPGGVNGTAASAGIPGVRPTFDPETLKDLEGGVKWDWSLAGVRGRINLAAYQSWYSDVQRAETILLPVSLGGGVTTQTNNIAAAKIRGLELEANFQLSRGLSASVNYAYTDAKYTRYPGCTTDTLGVCTPNINTPYVGVPKNQLTVGGRYALPVDDSLGEIALSTNVYYQSRTLFDDSVLQDPNRRGFQGKYAMVDARLDWNNISGTPIDVALFVRNITNHTHFIGYGNNLTSLGQSQATYNEPRMYGVQLRVQFD
nr:G165 [uncultured bacterium]